MSVYINMLCAINVYSEPNRHWQSERERECMGNRQHVTERRAGILKRREVGWLFCCFLTQRLETGED